MGRYVANLAEARHPLQCVMAQQHVIVRVFLAREGLAACLICATLPRPSGMSQLAVVQMPFPREGCVAF